MQLLTRQGNRQAKGRFSSPWEPKGTPARGGALHARTHACVLTHTHIRTAPRQLSSVFTQQVLLCNRGNKHADEDGGLEASSTLPPSPPRPQLQHPDTVLGVMLENLKEEEGNVTRQVRKEVAGVVRP